MRVPFHPEPVGRMRSRYANALETVYDVEGIARGVGPCPWSDRASVFDWHDGLRLVVWRERQPGGWFRLRFSASFILDGSFARHAAAMHPGQQAFKAAFLRAALFRFRELSRDMRAPSFAGFKLGMVPYWYIENMATSAEAV